MSPEKLRELRGRLNSLRDDQNAMVSGVEAMVDAMPLSAATLAAMASLRLVSCGVRAETPRSSWRAFTAAALVLGVAAITCRAGQE